MTERPFELAGRRVWVAGHLGMVGGALVRRLEREPCQVLTVGRDRLDLTRQGEVEAWLAAERPDAVIVAAARVGGILANDRAPVDFLVDNLQIETNVIAAAHRAGVGRLLFIGSSCIYPRDALQPITEDALLTGPLEPTNQWYAVAKIAGIKLCQAYRRQHGRDYIAAMPTNLYGPGDNFDLTTSHVVPALLRKAHDAKRRGDAALAVWGSGRPRREFLHVDDCADALVHLLVNYSDESHVNVGCGEDLTIADLAGLVCEIVGFAGELRFDASKPDGTPQKLLDVGRLARLGWRARIGLKDGLAATYRWFLDHAAEARAA
ncbi:MAG: GDP-L-fucose synthase [Alphaproteobacteria bacterium]